MGNLFLNSLEIEEFRGYKHLTIERFRRINLIVGANSVGKTSLLEAIQLLIGKGSANLIIELLNKRNEGIEMPRLGAMRRNDDATEDDILRVASEGLGYMFHSRPDISSDFDQHKFIIRALDNSEQLLMVKSSWFEKSEFDETATINGKAITRRRSELIDVLEGDMAYSENDLQFGLTIQIGEKKTNYAIDRYFRNTQFTRKPNVSSLNIVDVQGLNEKTLAAYWSKILLTDYEPDILKAVRIISPDIEDFAFRDDERGRGKYPIVRLKGVAKPVPFHSLGEGAVRILGIILALVNSRDGVLLIDEIDTGLHYSVQIKMWDFLFSLAEQLNVQVFATTHSQDCLSAFEYVANQHIGFGQLISLGSWKEFINASIINEQEMKIALENYIELRGSGQ